MYLKNNLIFNFTSSISIFFILLYFFNNQFEGFIFFYDILLVLFGYKCAKDYDNTKSIFEFYKQKFNEVAPPLIAAIFLGLIIVFFVFLEFDTSNYIKSSVYSLIFISNFFYWLNIYEFTQLYISVHPLINTWITSLVFQFYIYFPIIIFFNDLKFFNKYTNLIIILIIITGFILKILFFERDQSMYLLPNRIGELLLGSLLY